MKYKVKFAMSTRSMKWLEKLIYTIYSSVRTRIFPKTLNLNFPEAGKKQKSTNTYQQAMPSEGPRSNTPDLYSSILPSNSNGSPIHAGGKSNNCARRPLNLPASVHFQHRVEPRGIENQGLRAPSDNSSTRSQIRRSSPHSHT